MRPLAAETIAPAGDEGAYFRSAFGWMGAGLAVTSVVAFVVGRNGDAMHALLEGGGSLIFFVLLVIELLLVAGLVTLVRRMDLFETGAVFIAYAALNGVTISVVFAVYTTKSIFSTFLVAAAMFAALAVWSHTTNADLTRWGTFLFMVLVGQVVGVFVNLFWFNETLYWVTTATGVVLFAGLTAFDVQKLKTYEPPPASDMEVVQKDAIVGALALYLDFVNLFLYLLRIFGRRK